MGSIYKRTWKDKAGGMHQSKVLWIKYYRGGKSYRESTGSAKESDAKRLLRLREGDIVREIPVTPKVGRVKFDELAEDMMNDYRVNGFRSIEALETRFRLHLLPVFGGRRVAAITNPDIQKFVITRQKEGASNGEINRELAVMKRAFNLGAQAGKLMLKPHIPMLKEVNVRTGFFSCEEFLTVRKHLPEYLRSFVTFAFITGWKKGEITSIKWHQVDFKAGRVYLEPGTTKNDDSRWFPFTEELTAVLEKQREKTEQLRVDRNQICPFVFHYRNGRPIGDFRKSWKTACRKAGLPGRMPHDFRRTAVRNLVKAGIPERVAMQMAGHKTRSVFERYNIVSDSDLDQAAVLLDKGASR